MSSPAPVVSRPPGECLTSVANIQGRSTLHGSSCGKWQPRRAADTSINLRQSLFCCCPASMEQAIPTELKLLRLTVSFRRDLKTFCFILSTGTRIRTDSVMRPRSSSRRRNTSVSVTVYSYVENFIRLISRSKALLTYCTQVKK